MVVVGCTSKQSVSQCVKPPPASGVDNAASPDWQTPLNGIIFTLREGWSLYQQLEGTRSILMSSADRVAHIDGQLIRNYCETFYALRRYKCLKIIKPSNPFTNVCWVLFQHFCAATNFGCIDSFLLPNSKTEKRKWWVMVSFLVLLLPVCFEQ